MLPEFARGIKDLSAGVTSILRHTIAPLVLVALGVIAPVAYKRLEMPIDRRSGRALAIQTLHRAHQ